MAPMANDYASPSMGEDERDTIDVDQLKSCVDAVAVDARLAIELGVSEDMG